MSIDKLLTSLRTHYEYVIMIFPSLVIAYGNYLYLAKSNHYEMISNKVGIFLILTVLVISLFASTVKHQSDLLKIVVRRYVSIGLVFPSVLAIFIPVNVALTGGKIDDVFWSWMGCIFASIALSFISIFIGLSLRVVIRVACKMR